MSPSLETLKMHLDTTLCNLLEVNLLQQGVGLGELQGSLPALTSLSFCDSVKLPTTVKPLCAVPAPDRRSENVFTGAVSPG